MSSPVTEISVAKTEISVSGLARLLIWTHRIFYKGKCSEARSRKPSQPGWPGSYEEAPRLVCYQYLQYYIPDLYLQGLWHEVVSHNVFKYNYLNNCKYINSFITQIAKVVTFTFRCGTFEAIKSLTKASLITKKKLVYRNKKSLCGAYCFKKIC